jgi:hypothetical protein
MGRIFNAAIKIQVTVMFYVRKLHCLVACIFTNVNLQHTECGISQLTKNADNEYKNEAKTQIVTC